MHSIVLSPKSRTQINRKRILAFSCRWQIYFSLALPRISVDAYVSMLIIVHPHYKQQIGCVARIEICNSRIGPLEHDRIPPKHKWNEIREKQNKYLNYKVSENGIYECMGCICGLWMPSCRVLNAQFRRVCEYALCAWNKSIRKMKSITKSCPNSIRIVIYAYARVLRLASSTSFDCSGFTPSYLFITVREEEIFIYT